MGILGMRLDPLAVDVRFTRDSMQVTLADGREISAPLEWFPRLRKASTEQRKGWSLIGGGIGLHWEAIDEDVSVESLLSLD